MKGDRRADRGTGLVIDSPTVEDGATVESSDEKIPLDVMAMRHDGATSIVAIFRRVAPAGVSLAVQGIPGRGRTEATGGVREIEATGGKFPDDPGGHEVRLP